MAESEEKDLESRLAACPADSEEYSAMLSDLATLKLNKGEVEEAQRLLQQVYERRKDTLNELPATGPDADGTNENSDDWEDQQWEVPKLRTASSFEMQREQQQQHQQRQQQRSSGGGQRRAAPAAAAAVTGAQELDGLGVRDLPHVVEIFGLSRQVKTSQLEEFLGGYAWGGVAPRVAWVDDEHALAVFTCREGAEVLLGSGQKTFSVRSYNEACERAHLLPSEMLMPPSAVRPKTTTAIARRLIGNALGNNAVRDKQAEKELAAMRREKKQERQVRQQQLEAAWEEG